jgi:hypothetical protein
LPKIIINKVHDLLDNLDSLHASGVEERIYFRGQDKFLWGLLPTVFREDNYKYESSRYIEFTYQARTRYPNCPDDHDFVSWLFLMRHFGMPTRLLDWTQSPLVALFFAVENPNYQKFDGSLFSLATNTLLNYYSDYKGISLNDPKIISIFKDGFNNKQDIMLSFLQVAKR